MVYKIVDYGASSLVFFISQLRDFIPCVYNRSVITAKGLPDRGKGNGRDKAGDKIHCKLTRLYQFFSPSLAENLVLGDAEILAGARDYLLD